ncbi:MAG: hypothetical protein JHC52_03415 [Chthoniobacterales bacterium]|jgi:hypothetical protein|nr:hypothetical protein [Chthoniobacterales bacterium]
MASEPSEVCRADLGMAGKVRFLVAGFRPVPDHGAKPGSRYDAELARVRFLS